MIMDQKKKRKATPSIILDLSQGSSGHYPVASLSGARSLDLGSLRLPQIYLGSPLLGGGAPAGRRTAQVLATGQPTTGQPSDPASLQQVAPAESPQAIVARIAMETGVDPKIALSLWQQESSQSTDTNLKGPVIPDGPNKGSYGRGPWQIMTFHGDIPDTFEGQTRWAMKYLKEHGVEGYYGKGAVPGMPDMPTSSQYAQQVMDRAGGMPDVRMASLDTPSDTPTGNPVTGVMDQQQMPGFQWSPSEGEKFVNSLPFNLLFGGTRMGTALQNMYDQKKQSALQDFIAKELPQPISDMFKYDPQLAMQMMGQMNRGRSQIKPPEDTAHIKDWNKYQELKAMEADGQMPAGSADNFWNLTTNQKSPDWNRAFQQAATEGKAFPQDLKDATSQLNNYRAIIGDTLHVEDITKQIFNLSGESGWPNVFDWVRESDPRQMQKLVQTLQSSLAIDKMKELKKLSSSGATGFGALSERELDVLMSALSPLDPGARPEEFRHQLVKILEAYKNVYDSSKKGYDQLYGWYNKYNSPEYINKPLPYTFEKSLPNAFSNIQKLRDQVQSGPKKVPQLQDTNANGGWSIQRVE